MVTSVGWVGSSLPAVVLNKLGWFAGWLGWLIGWLDARPGAWLSGCMPAGWLGGGAGWVSIERWENGCMNGKVFKG